jgi:hypothetical protein
LRYQRGHALHAGPLNDDISRQALADLGHVAGACVR